MALNPEDTLRKHCDDLMNRAHVTGVGVGKKRHKDSGADVPCITVFVDQKVALEELAPNDRLPRELEGHPVDVVESGIFKAQ